MNVSEGANDDTSNDKYICILYDGDDDDGGYYNEILS